MKTCDACGGENPDDAPRCDACGTQLVPPPLSAAAGKKVLRPADILFRLAIGIGVGAVVSATAILSAWNSSRNHSLLVFFQRNTQRELSHFETALHEYRLAHANQPPGSLDDLKPFLHGTVQADDG